MSNKHETMCKYERKLLQAGFTMLAGLTSLTFSIQTLCRPDSCSFPAPKRLGAIDATADAILIVSRLRQHAKTCDLRTRPKRQTEAKAKNSPSETRSNDVVMESLLTRLSTRQNAVVIMASISRRGSLSSLELFARGIFNYVPYQRDVRAVEMKTSI